MSKLEPGFYRATLRGWPNQIGVVHEDGTLSTSICVGGYWNHHPDQVSDAHLLIVLDLENPKRFAKLLRDFDRNGETVFAKAAKQIEDQTKPVRISEPIWSKKVIAGAHPDPNRRSWLHANRNGREQWTDGFTYCAWDALIDPVLLTSEEPS